jgi:hypothetical protein
MAENSPRYSPFYLAQDTTEPKEDAAEYFL